MQRRIIGYGVEENVVENAAGGKKKKVAKVAPTDTATHGQPTLMKKETQKKVESKGDLQDEVNSGIGEDDWPPHK